MGGLSRAAFPQNYSSIPVMLICTVVCVHDVTRKQGVTKRCRRLSWLTNSALVMSPEKCARGEGGVRGLTFSLWVQRYTGAQINFGDLTPYLTYAMKLCCSLRGSWLSWWVWDSYIVGSWVWLSSVAGWRGLVVGCCVPNLLHVA